MPDAPRTTRREREHRPDGIYEITIGVVGERRLSSASAARLVVETALRERLDELFSRRGTHDGNRVVNELAYAIVDRLASEKCLATAD